MILAGGGATRLGGRDKPALPIAGVSMLDRVLAALAGADARIVVGPPRAGLPADDLRPAVWAAMLNAALRAAVEHHAYRTAGPDTGSAAARADLVATVRTALAVAAAGIA